MTKSINILTFEVKLMIDSSFHELSVRGTPDFPLEPYFLDENHPRYNMQFHWHKEYELINILKGSFTVILNGNSYELKEGESVFVPGGIIHGGTPKNCLYEVIVFFPSIMFATQKSKFVLESQIINPVFFKNNVNVEGVFKALRLKPEGYELSVIGNLYLLSETMLKLKDKNKIIPDLKIDKIKNVLYYIDKNYTENISLSELAKISSMNPNYFCRFFKQLTKETPIEYITRFRIEKACEMLVGGHSVTDTAYHCGFNDTSYFINIFKKHMGISPKQYQLAH